MVGLHLYTVIVRVAQKEVELGKVVVVVRVVVLVVLVEVDAVPVAAAPVPVTVKSAALLYKSEPSYVDGGNSGIVGFPGRLATTIRFPISF